MTLAKFTTEGESHIWQHEAPYTKQLSRKTENFSQILLPIHNKMALALLQFLLKKQVTVSSDLS